MTISEPNPEVRPVGDEPAEFIDPVEPAPPPLPDPDDEAPSARRRATHSPGSVSSPAVPDTASHPRDPGSEDMTQVSTSSPPSTESGDGVAEKARAVTTETKQQLGEVADVARSQVHDLVGGARHEVLQQTETQAQRLNGAVRDVGRQLRDLAEGNPSDGPVRTLARTAADRIDGFTGRIERDGVQGSLASVRDVARRRPVMFLAGAMAAGMVVGRVLRNADTRQLAQDATGNGSNPSSGSQSSAEQPGTPSTGASTGLGGTPPSAAPRDIGDMVGQSVGTTTDGPAGATSGPTGAPDTGSATPAPGGAGPVGSGQP